MTVLLFTGFPGFIASQLIREQLKKKKDDQFYTVVLASELVKAQQEKEAILSEYHDAKITIIEGDITVPNLDMTTEEQQLLASTVEIVWHLAAIYDLAVRKEAAWKVNVHGTSNVNTFVKSCEKLQRYMYFSTAYVAGTRTGILYENELKRPTSFKNYYEETKYEAELLVEDLKEYYPVTIIRPGIVRGNSITGKTTKFDGPYFLLNMVDKLKVLPFIPFIGRSTATLNTVPIDYIIEAASYVSMAKNAVGKTVHLTDPQPHPIQEVLRAVTIEMTGKAPKGTVPLALTRLFLKAKMVQRQLGVEYESLDYFTWDAEFDTAVATELLCDSGIHCADFIESLPTMVHFYEENKKNKAYQIKI
ncbi:SDR family oxidoreductase [Kurthia sibirica]|uniref:3-beta hydroxysteroid dehydrogenase n=1 Tax=Kurthia sibirica TaxID=202750 RepID=A0A2U3AQA9_9BACL|nr:SDR family oxidoreductase [Kurthia sibirica]PWI26731.1 3-beta hydroxysteroid dehydrogenase [Kurthia sibirica]GEK32739.1 3-beta hydroxysteroid dehydrogenase [Kurthia sibirica]